MSARRRAVLGLGVAAGLVAGELWALGSAGSYGIEPFRRRFAATPQAAVVARNDWGDLRVRTAAQGGLVVSAMIQRIGSAEAELEVRIEESAERVLVEVVPRVATPRGRVDLTLLVPPGKRFEGETRDGLVEVKYRGEVGASSRGGAITIETLARAHAESVSGAVVVRLADAAHRAPLGILDDGERATVLLPAEAGLGLFAETSGPIDVGFSAWSSSAGGTRRRVAIRLDAEPRATSRPTDPL